MISGITSSLAQAGSGFAEIPAVGNFVDTLKSAIATVNAQQEGAQNEVSSLLAGQGADVHTAMIAVQRAELSFELMMQLRNKVVAAYQEVARMQF
jgi:flagellar hook-basal body complex protein FliE